MCRTRFAFPAAWFTVAAVLVALALLPTAGSASCEPSLLFGYPSYHEAGVYPVSIAAADYNSDGFVDMAVTNLNSNTVTVHLGTGDGSFGARTSYPAGSMPQGIATADLDGDGILDLAVTNCGTSTVSILRGLGTLGHGDGSFAAPVSYTAGQENRGIAITDLDDDGHPDLVVAGQNCMAVLLNRFNGTRWGTFGTVTPYTTPWAWGVAVGDFDGDGETDAAVANWLTAEVDILLGHGDGTFEAGAVIVTPGGCSNIAAADLDRDGRLDLVAPGRGGLWIMPGHGDGTFGLDSYVNGHTFNGVTFADLDGDGNLDIAATDTDARYATVLPGSGDGTYKTAVGFPVEQGPIGIVAFDGNGDEAVDLFVACSGNGISDWAVAALINTCMSHAGPVLTAVRDVPNDQGGKVFVTWLRSRLDTATLRGITGYRVWRRAAPAAAEARVARSLASFVPGRDALLERRVNRPDGVEVEYWEALATLPAAFLEGYAYTAATTQDSLAGGNPYTAFFVQALTSDAFVFYNSEPDSGYSVDNLSPAQPALFLAQYSAGEVALHWSVSPEPDLAGYRLYSGMEPDFVPAADNLIASQADTGFVDHPASLAMYYKLSAVDIHGNESRFALVSPAGPTGVLATLVSAGYEGGAVRLVWSAVANPGVTATVYRSAVPGTWQALGTVTADGQGFLRYDDEAVSSGGRFGYRLGILDGEAEVLLGEAWVDVPVLALALRGALPNPVVDELTVAFSLPDASPARLDLVDLAGRRVASVEVGTLGAGSHLVRLGQGRRLAAGVYLIRLTQGSRTLAARAVVTR